MLRSYSNIRSRSTTMHVVRPVQNRQTEMDRVASYASLFFDIVYVVWLQMIQQRLVDGGLGAESLSIFFVEFTAGWFRSVC